MIISQFETCVKVGFHCIPSVKLRTSSVRTASLRPSSIRPFPFPLRADGNIESEVQDQGVVGLYARVHGNALRASLGLFLITRFEQNSRGFAAVLILLRSVPSYSKTAQARPAAKVR